MEDENPYQSPESLSGLPDLTVVVALRVLAVALWLFAPFPAIGFLVPMLTFETAKSRPELPVAVYVFGTIQFLLPTIGLAFLGAACWWRSRRLGMIGLYAFIPYALLVAIVLLRS